MQRKSFGSRHPDVIIFTSTQRPDLRGSIHIIAFLFVQRAYRLQRRQEVK